jgi:hypothetical protein
LFSGALLMAFLATREGVAVVAFVKFFNGLKLIARRAKLRDRIHVSHGNYTPMAHPPTVTSSAGNVFSIAILYHSYRLLTQPF